MSDSVLSLETVRDALAWATLLNFALLGLWLLAFTLVHDWLYQQHSRWFRLPIEKFDSIHYAGMALFKVGIILLNLVPYLALRIAG